MALIPTAMHVTIKDYDNLATCYEITFCDYFFRPELHNFQELTIFLKKKYIFQ